MKGIFLGRGVIIIINIVVIFIVFVWRVMVFIIYLLMGCIVILINMY